MKEKVCAILAAAGSSSRMKGKDKIISPLNGKPALQWSIETLQRSPDIDSIILVNSEKNHGQVQCLVSEGKWGKIADICIGGARRQDSVAAGLAKAEDFEWVLIHDAARPLLTEELIRKGLEAARETGATAAAVPVTDTIKRTDEKGFVIETPPRSRLWAVQTPQIFRTDILKDAYLKYRGEATDDASIVEQAGYKVKLYTGSYNNIKITTPLDFKMAEVMLKEYER
jgi:2-C-methyl-D-erythritol 4-phosphate cytidylyltransferase